VDHFDLARFEFTPELLFDVATPIVHFNSWSAPAQWPGKYSWTVRPSEFPAFCKRRVKRDAPRRHRMVPNCLQRVNCARELA
ncbi:MAG: hypothetical protein QF570_06540, partial [Myxococcota bacterium]|nr:hypothetical protein [Myxococcota bacterium]